MGTNPKIKHFLQETYDNFIVPIHSLNGLNYIEHNFVINDSDLITDIDSHFAFTDEDIFYKGHKILSADPNKPFGVKVHWDFSLKEYIHHSRDVYSDGIDEELSDPSCPYRQYLFPYTPHDKNALSEIKCSY